jgi:hypothetical protein
MGSEVSNQLEIMTRFCDDHPEIMKIHLFSDSASALKNITCTKAHPSQNTSRLFIKYAQTFLEDDTHRIQLQWVPGHSNLEINERADYLARRGCREEHEILSNTLSYYAEKRSKLALHKWKQAIQRQPLSGAFGKVTGRPPTTKPDPVVLQPRDKTEVFWRLTQIRTMHGHNTAYYARFNIQHNALCFCGHQIPPDPLHVRDHTLHNCEHFEEHRHILSAVSPRHDPAILLGTLKGLLATAKFLEALGAFTRNGRPITPPRPPAMPTLNLLGPLPDLDDPP